MREQWKAVTGYEGIYEVSNLGRIRSLDRVHLVNDCRGGISPRTDKGRFISPTDNGNGYLFVSLSNNGQRKNKYVHRLVAEAFCDNPRNVTVINHLNHDRADNRAINLEWVTQKENVCYSSDLMKKPKEFCKPTNTGEKYIYRRSKNGRTWYRVIIKPYKERRFNTLEEAIAYKAEVMQ